MTELELLLFNIDHGLSVVLIEKPENYVTVIDLGSKADFSPLKYLSSERSLRPDIIYVTHPHADHISDVNTARFSPCNPNYISYQMYDWNDVKSREQEKNRTLVDNYVTFINSNNRGDYRGNAELRKWSYTPEQAKQYFGINRYINNSSYFIIFKWQGFKIALPGDLESDAMEAFCDYDEFVQFAKGTDIFIAPHHGHKQGYYSGWIDKIGKPYVTLISIQGRDEHIADGYVSSEFAQGVTFNGEKRFCLTTRNDGNIKVRMYYNDNKPTWSFTSFE